MKLPNFAVFYGRHPWMVKPWGPTIFLQRYQKQIVGITAYWLYGQFHIEWFFWGDSFLERQSPDG